jgi:hypothetical protein
VASHAFPSDELRWVRQQLEGAFTRHRGLLLEDKGLSLALHYRQVPRLGGSPIGSRGPCRSRSARTTVCRQGSMSWKLKPAGTRDRHPGIHAGEALSWAETGVHR